MAESPFVHLHTHSEYSLLDGAARLSALVERAAELGMPALALTDHGSMHGAVEFYRKCEQAGIKPIIGVEAYMAPGGHTAKSPRRGKANYHLTLLARNEAGYRNLLRLTTLAATDGLYVKPRIDRELLEQHSDGLIVLSGCISGELSVALIEDDYERARASAAYYLELLGRDRFFLEMQDHGLANQSKVNQGLLSICSDLGLCAVCTNDVHYLSHEDAYAHDVLLCIGTGKRVSDADRLRYDSDQFYFKSASDMARAFPDHAEALARTAEIAEMCDLHIEMGRTELPSPEIEPGRTALEHLAMLSRDGLRRKVRDVTPAHEQRLEHELKVIEQTRFAEYILIVRDFARFARERGIYFGVRGSAAGSLTSYCVDITDVDPVHYDLTFERFLNLDRVEMPDIDMDFEDTRRNEVIEYVTAKYGKDHVAQIATFGTLAARAALRDAGRALGMPISQVNRVVETIPTQPIGITIEEALKQNQQLKALYDQDKDVRHLVDTARRLEGIARHSSVHAAGVVIAKRPLVEYTPLQRGSEGLVTQFPAASLVSVGLLKMDFLGLINLTILGRSIANIRRTREIEMDLHEIPLDDQATYELLGRGETMGVFQLESSGMRRNIAALKPTSVQDLAAMVALYRPGPMGSIPTFIDAKHGRKKVTYPDPRLEPVLSETYGVIVYQDQVLTVARAIAGFSLGQADVLRKAISKKKAKDIEKEHSQFIEGAIRNGLTRKQAEDIFELVRPFANYGFNKAHAVCYALLAYQTAYLKTHFPVEYMAAWLACFVEKPDKMAVGLAECRRMGIPVLGPDVNVSECDFIPDGDRIRFGLAAIKNVGRSAAEAILEARKAGGPFRSLDDFCTRMQGTTGLTRATAETLILCGAFDSIDPNRRALTEALDPTLQAAVQAARARSAGQIVMFADEDTHDGVQPSMRLPHVADFPESQRLAAERELLGVFLSGHPLERVPWATFGPDTVHIADIAEHAQDESVSIVGLVASVTPTQTKQTRQPMAFVVLEDTTGRVPITVFPRLYEETAGLLRADSIVRVTGRIREKDARRGEDEGDRSIEILAGTIEAVSLGSADTATPRAMHIRLQADHGHLLKLLRSTLQDYPGMAPVILHVAEGTCTRKVKIGMAVDCSPDARSALEHIVGRQAVWVE